MTIAKFPIIWGVPRTQSLAGNSFAGVTALTAYDDEHLEFIHTGDVDSKYYGNCYLDPDVLGASPTISAVKFIGELYANNAIAANVRVGVATKQIADAESFDPATLDTEVEQTVAMPTTAYVRKEISITLTAANFAKGDISIIQFTRNAVDTINDTMAQNLFLHKIAFIEVIFT